MSCNQRVGCLLCSLVRIYMKGMGLSLGLVLGTRVWFLAVVRIAIELKYRNTPIETLQQHLFSIDSDHCFVFMETRFSQPLCIFLPYICIYSIIFFPSVCWSGYKSQKCKNMEMRFSRLLFQFSVVHTYFL